ncbi:adenosine deaminase [Rhodocytophaga rosea]|uniref:adenosine deaminase n=1 Tax=Rhodocytophaga rosea TaxID=2704465 RepID=A0A6C0GVI2_9BACT|nr:adenosine deaminase [Rhodocytophaga rosea]QHT71340.1 adenosine deaminase [Rhodocytophaga rosea]
MNFTHFPKIELHLHLDCSLSYKVVQQLDPSISPETYQESFIAPPKCIDLADYIRRAIKGVELMQTEQQLRLVTLDLFEQLQADHVIYAEIRFAPLQHLKQGLNPRQVVQIVNDAVEQGIRATGIEAGIILCTLRHYSQQQSLETVHLVEEFKGSRVVGFDIAADEAGFPIGAHIAAFDYAKEKGIACTAHAGEAKGAESVWETLHHFHPSRIGHGVRSAENPALLEFLKHKGIHLEVCPTSNIQTNVYPSITSHTVDTLYKTGISLSINTDARTISDTTLAQEYELLHKIFSWQESHFLQCNLYAIEAAFTTEAVKSRLREKMYAGILSAKQQ